MRVFSIAFCLFILSFTEKVYSLRCKCNTQKGLSRCYGDYCDIHSQDGKRAACGALRRARQTIFACVLIKQTSNDTYCHVVRSTTACWCRSMDFCNADLESELFDVDDDSEQFSSSDEVDERVINDVTQQDNLESTTITTTIRPRPTPIIIHATTKRSAKTKINQAIEFDAVKKIKLKAEPKQPLPTVNGEALTDNYEDELGENDDGFQWQAISIPERTELPSTTAIPTQSEISESTSSERLNQIANSISVIINEVTEITETTSLVTTSAPITTTKSTTFQIPQQKQDNKQYVRSESQWNPPFVSQRPHNPIPKVISSTTITTANNPSTLRSTNSFTSSVTSTTGGVSKIIVIQKPPRVAIDRFLPSSRDRRIKVQRYSPSPTILYSQSAPKTLLDHWEFQTEEKPSGSTTRAFTSRFTSLIVPVTVLCLYSLIYF